MRPITLIPTLCALLLLLPGTAVADSGGGWTWPVRGPVITAYRNGSDPYAGGQHRGVDIGAPVGARVVAAAAGTVTFAGVAGSSGLTVSERTGDSRFDLSYLHLSSASVQRGDVVPAGAVLGAVGTSGRRSVEATHLHFGVREAGSRSAYRDPLDFLAPPPAADAPPDPAPAPVPVPVPEAHPATPAPVAVAVAQPAAAEDAPAPGSRAGAAEHGPALAAAPHLSPLPGMAPTAAAPPEAAHGLRSARVAPGVSAAGGVHTAAIERAPRTAAPDGRPGPVARRPDGQVAARGPDSQSAPARPAASRHAAGTHGKPSGIDLGWLAACLGLIAAATALGHPDGTRRVLTRGRARLGSLLRPALRAPHRQ